MHSKKIAFNAWGHLGDYTTLTALLNTACRKYPDMSFTIRARNKSYLDIFMNNPNISEDSQDAIEVHVEYNEGNREPERRGDHGTFVHAYVRAGLLGVERAIGCIGYDVLWRDTAEFFLTEEEKHKYDYLGDYMIINAGFQNKYATKGYPHYQDIVNLRPDIKFVQMGGTGPDDVHITLHNVIDMIGRTSVRDLICLIYSSKGLVSPPSGCVNIASAFPHVPVHCIIGGRELPILTGYPNVRHYQSTVCEGYGINRGCMLRRCSNTDGGFSRCMADVCPEYIAESL